VTAVVRFDHHKRLFLDAVFLVLSADLGQQCIHLGAELVHTGGLQQIHALALVKHWVDQPRVNAQQLAQPLGNLFVTLEMLALAACGPARMQWRELVLLVDLLQNARNARTEIVVQQNGARVKIFQTQTALGPDDGLQGHFFTGRQLDGGGFFDRRIDGSHAHVQPSHVENSPKLCHVGEVGRAAGLVLGNQQQVPSFGANFLNRGHGRLDCQWQHLGSQVFPAAGKQIGVDRRQLEASISNINRAIEGWRVLHPLQAEPTLDGGGGVQHALLQFIDGAVECGDEMWNHAALCSGIG
jgi:hypothetical protein